MTPDAYEGRDRVLQFGTGRFLRGFVDAFLDEEDSRERPCRRCGTTERDRGRDLGLGVSAPLGGAGLPVPPPGSRPRPGPRRG